MVWRKEGKDLSIVSSFWMLYGGLVHWESFGFCFAKLFDIFGFCNSTKLFREAWCCEHQHLGCGGEAPPGGYVGRQLRCFWIRGFNLRGI